MSTITHNDAFGIYTIRDEGVLIDLFEAKIIDTILRLRDDYQDTVSFMTAADLVSVYIDKYNRKHGSGCRTILDAAKFEAMRIRAGEEYSLAE